MLTWPREQQQAHRVLETSEKGQGMVALPLPFLGLTSGSKSSRTHAAFRIVRVVGRCSALVVPMASLAHIASVLFLSLLLVVGQLAQAGACSCHHHDAGEHLMTVSVAGPSHAVCSGAVHGGHESGGSDCSCACHDLSTRAGEAVSTVITTPVPPFVARPGVFDWQERLSFGVWQEAARCAGPSEETPPPSDSHRGFVCPLRS